MFLKRGLSNFNSLESWCFPRACMCTCVCGVRITWLFQDGKVLFSLLPSLIDLYLFPGTVGNLPVSSEGSMVSRLSFSFLIKLSTHNRWSSHHHAYYNVIQKRHLRAMSLTSQRTALPFTTPSLAPVKLWYLVTYLTLKVSAFFLLQNFKHPALGATAFYICQLV